MRFRDALPVTVVLATVACSTATTPDHERPSDCGVLVMAHGGDPPWNEAVEGAVAPLRQGQHVEIAFGMADAATIQDAVGRLEARGVRRIAVVRLFVSGESWWDRTRQIFGLEEGAPARAASAGSPGHEHHSTAAAAPAAHAGHSMEFWQIETNAEFALSRDGLTSSPAMGAVLATRARGLSRDPHFEDVLVLAPGPGDDDENERWIAAIDSLANAVRRDTAYRRVEVMTLREDWPDKRTAAEQRIRAFVTRAREQRGRAVVIPFRVHGFGPYAEVLDGLEYAADGNGLLPHPAVTDWIAAQARALRQADAFEKPRRATGS